MNRILALSIGMVLMLSSSLAAYASGLVNPLVF